jgi:Golgi-resident PAP phosphatase
MNDGRSDGHTLHLAMPRRGFSMDLRMEQWSMGRPIPRLLVVLGSLAVVLLLMLYAMTTASGLEWIEGSTTTPSVIDVRRVFAMTIHAVHRGGLEVVRVKEGGDLATRSKGTIDAGATGKMQDPVTAADMASHRVMTRLLRAAYPFLALVSEEHDDEETVAPTGGASSLRGMALSFTGQLPELKVAPSDVTVWIDPLDATKEFTEGLYQYVTVMGCVVVGGEPIAGVIHFPMLNKTFWGYSTPSGKRGVSPEGLGRESVSRHSKVVVSRSHTDAVERLAGQLGKDTTVVKAGGAGYKAVAVADGSFDAYLHTGPIKKWDICAPNALLRAVGGDLTGLRGQTIRYGKNDDPLVDVGVAATSQNHRELLKRLQVLLAGD